MLKAILHSKVGSQFSNLAEDTHWREVYRTHEDFLTAAIIGRLIYLDPTLLWGIIKNAVVSNHNLLDDVGYLKDVQFWPHWLLPHNYNSESKFREPDVFLRFENLDIIVEAKLEFATQYSQQLAEEYIAYTNSKNDKNCFVMAIGGLRFNEKNHILDLEYEANKLIEQTFPGRKLCLMGCTWNTLSNVIDTIRSTHIDSNNYLFKDLKDIFELHAIRQFQNFEAFIRKISSSNLIPIGKESALIFEKLIEIHVFKTTTFPTQIDWINKIQPWMNIKSASMDTLRRGLQA